MAITIIREDYTHARHDLLFTRVVVLNDGRRLRTSIRRNSHDFQSSAHVETWTPAGWVEVVALPGEHERMKALPSYVTRDDVAAHDALKALAIVLEDDADEVTRP